MVSAFEIIIKMFLLKVIMIEIVLRLQNQSYDFLQVCVQFYFHI